jgi:hypothetical protein
VPRVLAALGPAHAKSLETILEDAGVDLLFGRAVDVRSWGVDLAAGRADELEVVVTDPRRLFDEAVGAGAGDESVESLPLVVVKGERLAVFDSQTDLTVGSRVIGLTRPEAVVDVPGAVGEPAPGS